MQSFACPNSRRQTTNTQTKIFIAVPSILLAIIITLCAVNFHIDKAEALQCERDYQVTITQNMLDDQIEEELARENVHRQIVNEQKEKEEQERLAQQAKEEEERRIAEEQAQQTAVQPTSYTPTYSSSSTLTKSGGVNYYNGSRETWYSSNTLYHKNTSNWTLGSDGVYRDNDGYVIVARSDMSQGSTIETSLGTGKVYDSGCAAGTTDIYTAW